MFPAIYNFKWKKTLKLKSLDTFVKSSLHFCKQISTNSLVNAQTQRKEKNKGTWLKTSCSLSLWLDCPWSTPRTGRWWLTASEAKLVAFISCFQQNQGSQRACLEGLGCSGFWVQCLSHRVWRSSGPLPRAPDREICFTKSHFRGVGGKFSR